MGRSAKFDWHVAYQRFLQGESQSSIAKDLRVSPSTLCEAIAEIQRQRGEVIIRPVSGGAKTLAVPIQVDLSRVEAAERDTEEIISVHLDKMRLKAGQETQSQRPFLPGVEEKTKDDPDYFRDRELFIKLNAQRLEQLRFRLELENREFQIERLKQEFDKVKSKLSRLSPDAKREFWKDNEDS